MELKLTAIIITKNNEEVIKDCLKSISWVDEIIVADSSSTDKTVQIAKRYKAKVVVLNGISSFAKIRNKAAKKAHGEWLFYIDADERATPELKKEILTKINSKNPTSYDIPRKNYIFGKWFRHGGQWPDRVLRLIKKEAFIKYVGDLHEQPKIKGEMGSLENYMIHRKDMTLSQMVEKTNLWSEVEARLMFEADHPPMNIPRFVSAMLREFWHQFVKQAIFLDGPKGIIYGLYQVYSRFISYAKLWEMQIAS